LSLFALFRRFSSISPLSSLLPLVVRNEVSEQRLLRELLYCFQAIDSTVIKYYSSIDGYALAPQVSPLSRFVACSSFAMLMSAVSFRSPSMEFLGQCDSWFANWQKLAGSIARSVVTSTRR
jgi:hypothetical protein